MTFLCVFLLVAAVAAVPSSPATAPWDHYNYSPESRTVLPRRLHSFHNRTNTNTISFPLVLQHDGDDVVIDFGKEVGGYTTVNFGKIKGTPSVTFYWSESSLYIQTGDDSKGSPGTDGGLNSGMLTTNATWTATGGDLRGGFRYLRIVINNNDDNDNTQITKTTGTFVSIAGVSVYFTASPHIQNLRAYKNHFMSSCCPARDQNLYKTIVKHMISNY